MQYIERDGTEHFHTLKLFPETLTKKVTLLKYLRNYMQEHLLKVCVFENAFNFPFRYFTINRLNMTLDG